MRTVIVRDQVFPTITNDDIKNINARNVVEVQLQSVFVDRTIPADNYSNGTFGPRFTYVILHQLLKVMQMLIQE